MPDDPILAISHSGLAALDFKMRALSSDVANLRTPGYRSSQVVFKSFPLLLNQSMGKVGGDRVAVTDVVANPVKGNLIATNVLTDLALQGRGYFAVQVPWGTAYTRDGRFYFDKVGRLLTVSGDYPVLGRGGPIAITPGSQYSFSQTGEVIVDGQKTDQLFIVDFPHSSALQTVNGSLFRSTEEGVPVALLENEGILSGFLELSNVNVVDSMAQLVMLQRLFDYDATFMKLRGSSFDQLLTIAQPTQ